MFARGLVCDSRNLVSRTFILWRTEAADFEADAIIKCAKSSWATVEGGLDKVDGVESSLLRVRNKVCENQKAR